MNLEEDKRRITTHKNAHFMRKFYDDQLANKEKDQMIENYHKIKNQNCYKIEANKTMKNNE